MIREMKFLTFLIVAPLFSVLNTGPSSVFRNRRRSDRRYTQAKTDGYERQVLYAENIFC